MKFPELDELFKDLKEVFLIVFWSVLVFVALIGFVIYILGSWL